MPIDLVTITDTRHKFSVKNKIARVLWAIVYLIFFRFFTFRFFRKWRVLVLKCFGAEISWNCTIHASVKVWAPWNLKVGEYSCIGQGVDCYNQGMISIGSNTTISQKVYLCASTHDFTLISNPLILKPITIEDRVWVAADAFIGPGVTIYEGAVVGARAAVFRNVDPWTVVGGNPIKFIKMREIIV